MATGGQMAELRRFYRDSSSYLAGRVCVMLLGFISFPVFTRLYSVSDYGVINLVISTILIASVFSKAGLQNSVQRFHKEHAVNGVSQMQRCYTSIFAGAAAVALITTLVFSLVVVLIPNAWLSTFAKQLLLISACLIFLRPLRSMVQNLWQVEGKTFAVNAVDIVVKGASIAAIVALILVWHHDVMSFVIGTVVVESAVMFVVFALIAKRDVLNFNLVDWSFAWESLRFGFPLMWAEIAYMVLDSGDRFVVQHYLGSQAVGLYSAAYGVASYIPEVLLVPINLALFPIVMQVWVEKGKDETQKLLSRSLNQYLMAAIGFVCVVSISSREAIILLASRKYQEAHTLLPILVAGLMLYAVHVFLRPALLIEKKSNVIATQIGIAAMANLVLNVLMVPRMGVAGAAYATLLSYGICLTLMARESLRIIPLSVNWGSFFKCVIAALVTGFLVSQIRGDSVFLLFLKICLASLLYATVLWISNRDARAVMRNIVGLLRQRASSAGAARLGREVSVDVGSGQ
jgi:O-antigen/teichoic acid export membrane protein